MDFIPNHIQDYAEKFTAPEPAILTELTLETHKKVLYPQMLSGHIQGRFLAMISKIIQPGLILEIGTYTGYSGICLAEGLKPGGKLITIDVNQELEPYVKKYFEQAGIADKTEMIFGDAGKILTERKIPADLVFIDADKENYKAYYELLIPNLPSGAVILADNVLWSGRVTDINVNDKETAGLREFSKFVADDSRVENILLPIRDGIMFLRKK